MRPVKREGKDLMGRVPSPVGWAFHSSEMAARRGVGLPAVSARGGVGFVGEVPVEESLGPAPRVACFVENVVEDVGDVEGFCR